MGEASWTRADLGRELVVWETTPRGQYAIFLHQSMGSWSVSLQQHCYPLHTITGLQTESAAQKAAVQLQFKLAIGAIDTTTPSTQPTAL